MAEPVKPLDLPGSVGILDTSLVEYPPKLNNEVSWPGGRPFEFTQSFFSRFRSFVAFGLDFIAHAGGGVSPMDAELNPLAIDEDTMDSINDRLNGVAKREFNAVFDKCNSEQKVKVLKLTLETKGKFGLEYDRRMNQRPQTVMEFLTSKSGNCADFSRLLVAVAKERNFDRRGLEELETKIK